MILYCSTGFLLCVFLVSYCFGEPTTVSVSYDYNYMYVLYDVRFIFHVCYFLIQCRYYAQQLSDLQPDQFPWSELVEPN